MTNEELIQAIESDVERINRMRYAAPRLHDALKSAVRIAGEAQKDGKILIALAGGCSGYRTDIDEIHAAIRSADGDEQ